MSNRFLFLEKELTGFDANNTKKKGFMSKTKSKYSTQKIAPAAAAAVVAAVGVGWKIFEFGWAQTEGDIDVKLARMEGSKLPSDDTSFQNKGVWQKKTIRVYKKFENYATDEISAKFDLSFKYNGYGVGYIDMDHVESNDAIGWGLKVEAKLMADPQNYTSNNGGQSMSMIEVTFNYRFSRSIGSDVIKIQRYKLYGDGTVI
ncbi:hypothetical protein [Lacinutrix sp. Hel_I_90]|uniref:hypothetical protein n=1 Tax=Lacinutrix sp. Hel_I_90 TaxID=1249999 RepID=UPI0005CACDD2|nr:hypothetical protein [Lacinutrix sp. Hel_I_90]